MRQIDEFSQNWQGLQTPVCEETKCCWREKQGKKQFAVISYEDFVRMQEELEDYHDLLELRRAKSDPRNQKGPAFNIVAAELGLKKKRV